VSARGGECEWGVVDTGRGQLGRDEVEIEEGKRKKEGEKSRKGEGKGRSTYRNLTHSLVPRAHLDLRVTVRYSPCGGCRGEGHRLLQYDPYK
jgi:hypothetical protein